MRGRVKFFSTLRGLREKWRHIGPHGLVRGTGIEGRIHTRIDEEESRAFRFVVFVLQRESYVRILVEH